MSAIEEPGQVIVTGMLVAGLLAVSLASGAFAQSSDDIVSRGHVVERERGEPLIAVPQTLPADLENRNPSNLTIMVEPLRAGVGDSRQDRGSRPGQRDGRR